jgi:hypothetical protein
VAARDLDDRGLVHQEAQVWLGGQTSGTLEDRCPDREFAMERVTASARP